MDATWRRRLLLPLVGAGMVFASVASRASAHPPSFASKVDYPNAGGLDIAAADVTGDGILDLVTVGGSTYGFKVLPGNGSGGVGNGTFGGPLSFSSGFGEGLATGQWGVVARDFNNDSRQDVAIANRYTDNVSVAMNNGQGFDAAIRYPLLPESSPRAVTAGYFNSDDLVDLAVADWGQLGDHATDHWISVLLGDPGQPGRFLPEVRYDAVYQNNPNGVTPADIIAADLDGDGQTDLATANTGSDDVDVFTGRGDGTFQTGLHYGYDGLDCISTLRLAAGDLNGDSKLDLAGVCSSGASNNLEVLLNQGDGTFPESLSPLIEEYLTDAFPRDTALADFNRDGKLDAVVANHGAAGEGSVSIFEGNGDGTFKARADYPIGGLARSEAVTTGDFNGDGLVDVAVANASGDTASILMNDTVLEPPPPVLSGISPQRAATGAEEVTLTAWGAHFFRDSIILFNGSALVTRYVSPTRITGILAAGDLASGGEFPVAIFTEAPGGGTSNAIVFSVTADGAGSVPTLSPWGLVTMIVLVLSLGVPAARRIDRR